MISQPEDLRRLFGPLDSEISDGAVGAALAYAAKQIQQMSGKSWDGRIEREYIGTSDGKTTDFLTGLAPVLDGQQTAEGEITDVSSDVTIETRDIGGSSYSTVSTGTYALKGEKGHIIFSTIPAEGKEIFATYFYDRFKIIFVESALAASRLFANSPNGINRSTEIYNEFVQAMSGAPFYLKLVPRTPPMARVFP